MGLLGVPSSQTITPQVASPMNNNTLGNNGMFATGFNVPYVSSIISYLYPRFYLTSLLDRMAGRSVGIGSQVHSWAEKDRTRPRVTIASLVTAVGSATINVTVDAASLPAMVVGRCLYGSSSVDAGAVERLMLYANVTAVSGTTITLAKNDGSNWTAAEIATTGYQSLWGIGPVYVGEGSSAPLGYWTPPTVRNNVLSTIRDSRTFSGNMLTQKSYLGAQHSDIQPALMEFLLEFQVSRELRAKFGRQNITPTTVAPLQQEGIFDAIFNRGSNTNYGGPLTESALQNHMVPMMRIASKPEWLVLCGTDYSVGFHNANQQYAIGSAELDRLGFGGDTNVKLVTAGFAISSYKLQNAIVHLQVDPMFDDPNILTMTGNTSMGSYRNFRNAGCWINLGPGLTDSMPLVRLMHNEGNGVSRKFVYNEIQGQTGTPIGGGMTSEDINAFSREGQVATDVDGVRCLLLSEEGNETRNPQWMGWHFKTA